MNDLEDRLRAALRERAEDFSASPGAWERTVARARWSRAAGHRRWRERHLGARGSLARLASASFAPLAAAAALVAIVVAIGAVAHFAGRNRGPSSGRVAIAHGSASAGSDAMPTPPGVDSSMLQSTPPGTAVVQVTQVYGGQVSWTYFWFGRGANANQMCTETMSDQLPAQSISAGSGTGTGFASSSEVTTGMGTTGCMPVSLPRGQLATWVSGSELTMNVCQGLGIAARQVVSVTAVLPGGRQVPGIVRSGRGFRYKVWSATYPQKDAGHTTLVFRDAAGRVVAHMVGR